MKRRLIAGWRRVALVLLLALLSSMASGCGSSPQMESHRREEPQSGGGEQRSGDRYDLARDEQRGGHTLARHVARTDEQLRERLARERNISAASTWTDQSTAEQTVAQALKSQNTRVDKWMQRGYPRANLALHYDAGQPIGRSLHRGESQSVTCTSAVIVLRADGTDSYFVLTTYPEARE